MSCARFGVESVIDRLVNSHRRIGCFGHMGSSDVRRSTRRSSRSQDNTDTRIVGYYQLSG